MPLKWTFPPTGGGVEHGFNDSAQEHFRNDAWRHTIRELIQNSLDAVRNKGKPVVVEISVSHIPSSELGASDLAAHVDQALKRTRKQGERQGEKFYAAALKILKRDKIKTLAVKDANTTGLAGGKWDALVYNEGTTNKGDMNAAGGSFGLGKSAPYLVSELKTVCYSTYYSRPGREERFIARCKLVAHEDPNGANGELQHIGFGTKVKVPRNKRPPPTRGQSIYKDFRLRETGSAIFIAGFNPLLRNWLKVAERSIAESFFEAVHTEKLRINLDGISMTRDTLDEVFEHDSNNRSFYYYRIVRGDPGVETAHIETDLGQFTLKFYIGKEGMSNRIAYVNRRGMLVTDTRQRGTNPFYKAIGRGWAKYAAVIMASDDETDKKIREMEPPNHGTIEPGRIINPKRRGEMEAALADIRDKIAMIIGEALRLSIKDQEINVSELADVMPIDDNDDGGTGGQGQDGEAELSSRKLKPQQAGESYALEEGGSKGTTKHKKKARKTKHNPKNGSVAILEKIRIMRANGKMRVAFTPTTHTGDIRFVVRPAGEERMREHAIVVSDVKAISKNTSVRTDDKAVVVSPKNGDRIVLDLTVGEDKAYTGYEIACFSTGEQK